VAGGIGIRRDRTRFRIDLDHAEARTEVGWWRRCKYPALGRDTDPDESEIIAERLHGFQGWTDFAGIRALPVSWAAARMPAARMTLTEARANMVLFAIKSTNHTVTADDRKMGCRHHWIKVRNTKFDFMQLDIQIVASFSGSSAYVWLQATPSMITRETGDDWMRQIPLGTKGTFILRVQSEHLANQFKDAMLPQVLATPVMVLAMENAALNAIRPFLEAGESAVGTEIDVRHLAATPLGHNVRAEAEVIEAVGKRIEFKVSASDEIEEIGNGTHQRAVINLQSFNERLAIKRTR
jgi:fluoroacetyl-CoA thioesterase